jgi:hypothetical protein
MTGIAVGSLILAGAIVWGLDSGFPHITPDSTPPSTMGQGSPRPLASEPAPAVIEGQAIKLEPSATEAVKTYDLGNPVDSRWPEPNE